MSLARLSEANPAFRTTYLCDKGGKRGTWAPLNLGQHRRVDGRGVIAAGRCESLSRHVVRILIRTEAVRDRYARNHVGSPTCECASP